MPCQFQSSRSPASSLSFPHQTDTSFRPTYLHLLTTSSPALLPPQVRVQRIQPSNLSLRSSLPSSSSPHDFEGTPTFRRQVQAYTSCVFDFALQSALGLRKEVIFRTTHQAERLVHFTISIHSATGILRLRSANITPGLELLFGAPGRLVMNATINNSPLSIHTLQHSTDTKTSSTSISFLAFKHIGGVCGFPKPSMILTICVSEACHRTVVKTPSGQIANVSFKNNQIPNTREETLRRMVDSI